MGRQKQLVPDDKEQSARFEKVAKEVLSEDADALFEDALKKILKPKQKEAKKD